MQKQVKLIKFQLFKSISSPALLQSTDGAPGEVLVPGLSCPLLSTHQQYPLEP